MTFSFNDGPVTFMFDHVSRAAFRRLVETVRHHGVEFSLSTRGSDALGTFRSESGSGTIAYDGDCLTVTILESKGHFPPRMIKGGLRQLVQEAIEAPYGHEIAPLPCPAHE